MIQQNHQPERAKVGNYSSFGLPALLCLVTVALFFNLGPAFSARANAQEIRAKFQGKVVDSTGAVIKDAQVTALEIATGIPTHTVTNDAGEFVMPFMTPGITKLTFK